LKSSQYEQGSQYTSVYYDALMHSYGIIRLITHTVVHDSNEKNRAMQSEILLQLLTS